STDAVLGTVSYVSPEQLKKEEVGGAADLYALGAVAYECLTGAPPFDSLDREVIVHDHLSTPPPPLPEDVPDDVAAVVIRSLQKSPADRWESAGALARACRAAMGGEPSTPIPVTSGRKERPAGLWSWRFGFVAVAVIALMLLTGLFAWSPWNGSEGSQAEESTTTAASPSDGGTEEQSLEESPSSQDDAPQEAAEATAEETEGGATPTAVGDDDAGQDQQEDSGEEDEDTPASGSATMPDVTGMTTFQARDELAAAGFENVTATVGYYWISPEPEHCTVIQQTPMAGTTADR